VSNEWVEWHRQYDEGDKLLAGRLKLVQERIREALDRSPAGPIRIISLCAGDGRDILGALEGHPRANDVRARLVEITPELAEQARVRAARQGLAGIEVVTGDASATTAYESAVPARLALVCGVFGNITDDDIRNTIDHLPELCAPDATVIWTRGRFEPDLTPTIRRWFRDAGFEELTFEPISETTASVGTNRLVGTPRPFRPGVRLFTFLPKEERPSQRARKKGEP